MPLTAMAIPILALSIAYWFHMLATVLWIGGLSLLSLLVLPAARKTLQSHDYADFIDDLQRRLDPLGWLSITILLASGMFQMSASEHYEGFLSISSLWATAILVKHLLFGLMVALSGYVTWGVLPGLRRAALLRAKGKAAPEVRVLHQRSRRLVQANLVLGGVVLLLTAIARSA
jgi:uncharacterized membrane protein